MFSQPSVMKTEVLSISSTLKFKLSFFFFCYKTKRKLTEYFSSVRRMMRKTVLCKYTRSSLESLHSMQSFNTFKNVSHKGFMPLKTAHVCNFFSNLFLIFCRLSNAGVHAIPLFFFAFIFFEKFSLRKMIILSRFLLISPLTFSLSLSLSLSLS